MSDHYGECEKCGDVTPTEDLNDGKCRACYDLSMSSGETVEVPASVLKKLQVMAESRHPTTCTQVAPVFNNVLAKYGVDQRGDD